VKTMAFMPLCRMGPPPRSFAADAQDCIMVRVIAAHRIQGCGTILRAPQASSPRHRHPDHNERAAVLGAVKVWPGIARRMRRYLNDGQP
jgi:hypothetical protein